jgi:uncharacterized protein (DUF697 family)
MALIPSFLVSHISETLVALRSYLNDDFSQTSLVERQKLAADVRKIGAGCAAAIAPMPLPFADIWAITTVQYMIVRAIGNIYGHKLDINATKEVLAVIGGGMLGQQICLQLFKWGLPGAGGIGGMAFVYAWTCGMSVAAETYFKSDGKATKEELKKAREQGMAEAKTRTKLSKNEGEIDPTSNMTTPDTLESRLGKLKVLFQEGLIDKDEYKRQKERLLNNI